MEEDQPVEEAVSTPKGIIRYYVHTGEQTLGPWSFAQIQGHWRRKSISEEAQICEVGEEEWQPIAGYRDRLDFHPVDRHKATPVAERKKHRARRSKKRKNGMSFLIILGILLVLGAISAIIYFAGVAF